MPSERTYKAPVAEYNNRLVFSRFKCPRRQQAKWIRTAERGSCFGTPIGSTLMKTVTTSRSHSSWCSGMSKPITCALCGTMVDDADTVDMPRSDVSGPVLPVVGVDDGRR